MAILVPVDGVIAVVQVPLFFVYLGCRTAAAQLQQATAVGAVVQHERRPWWRAATLAFFMLAGTRNRGGGGGRRRSVKDRVDRHRTWHWRRCRVTTRHLVISTGSSVGSGKKGDERSVFRNSFTIESNRKKKKTKPKN